MAYLTNTVRSQRFSRSQRFTPTRTLRLCFAPHPPLGFRSSELSSARVSRSISRCPLLSCRWTSTRPKLFRPSALTFHTAVPSVSSWLPESLAATQLPHSAPTSSAFSASKPASSTARGRTRIRHGAESQLRPWPPLQNGQGATLPVSVGPDFRALLRPSVRTLCPVFSQLQSTMLS